MFNIKQYPESVEEHRSSSPKELKVVIAGSVGSGKTTAIHAISQVPVIGTESKASEQDALHRKETTTTAMEYGITHLKGRKLHLYGTPGQRRFDFMADILCKGANGIAILIDNGCHDPIKEIDYYLQRHGDFLTENAGIIGITHFDDLRTDTRLFDYHQYVINHGFSCPVMKLDARQKKDVDVLLQNLLLQISHAKTGKTSLYSLSES